MDRAIKFTTLLGAFIFAILIAGCGNDEPPREEIPFIKDQLARLEAFYAGTYTGALDTLLTREFAATSADRGHWGALTVENASWPFAGSAGRSFFYTAQNAEVELSFLYRSSDQSRDSALPAKISLIKDRDRWLIESVKAQTPLTY